jgi:hypothetical protein
MEYERIVFYLKAFAILSVIVFAFLSFFAVSYLIEKKNTSPNHELEGPAYCAGCCFPFLGVGVFLFTAGFLFILTQVFHVHFHI